MKAKKSFFRPLFHKHKDGPRKIVTDKLWSYGAAHRELIPDTIHAMNQAINNRTELSHKLTGGKELDIQKSKSMHQVQKYVSAHVAKYNLNDLGATPTII